MGAKSRETMLAQYRVVTECSGEFLKKELTQQDLGCRTKCAHLIWERLDK